MKKVFILMLAMSALMIGCSKDDENKVEDEGGNSDIPVVDNDKSSAGIYNGISKDTMCYVNLNIMNGGEEIKGSIHLEGEEYELTPLFDDFTAGEALVEGEFSFSGGVVTVDITQEGEISGFMSINNVDKVYELTIAKSRSTAEVHIYAGEYWQQSIELDEEWEFTIHEILMFDFNTRKAIRVHDDIVSDEERYFMIWESDFELADNIIKSELYWHNFDLTLLEDGITADYSYYNDEDGSIYDHEFTVRMDRKF